MQALSLLIPSNFLLHGETYVTCLHCIVADYSQFVNKAVRRAKEGDKKMQRAQDKLRRALRDISDITPESNYDQVFNICNL